MASDTVGAWPPPPGVTPNFTNPESIGYRIIVASVLFPAITIPITLLRLYTKRYILEVVHVDDYFIVVATLFALGLSALNCYQTTNGLGAHVWDIPLYKFSRFLKIGGIAGPIFYNIATLFTKASLSFFYLRLSPSRIFSGVVYTTLAITIIYCLLAAFAFSFLCQPIQRYWDFSAPGSCVNINAFGVTMAAVNAATDVMLLVLPILIIWPLQSLSVWKRISLAFILMAGSFVCVVSIIRLQVLIAWTKNPEIDGTRTMVTTFTWLIIETWCSIICANLPNLRAFIRRHFPRVHVRAAETKFPATREPELGANVNRAKPGHISRDRSSILLWTVDNCPNEATRAATDPVSFVLPSTPTDKSIPTTVCASS